MSDAESERNKSVVRRFLDEVSDGGNLALIDDLCAPDIVNHAARPGLQNGIDALKQLVTFIHQAQTGRRPTEQRFVAEGEFVVVFGVREGIWQAPEFRGIPTPNSGRVSTDLAHMWRVRDGLICEHWAVRDDLDMLRQLGALGGCVQSLDTPAKSCFGPAGRAGPGSR